MHARKAASTPHGRARHAEYERNRRSNLRKLKEMNK
jgi:hypothetical protein